MISESYEAGTIDLTKLVRRWQLLDALYRKLIEVNATRTSDILHSRMIDENQVGGHRVYMVAERYLGVAWDNHQAFRALIQGPHGVTPSAPYNLLRPTFEAAFYATWVLESDDSIERRRRALRVEYLDEVDHRRYYEELLRMRSTVSENELADARSDLADRRQTNATSYSSDASALDLPFPPPGVNVLDELGRLTQCSATPDSDVLLRTTWRMLSGHQHGRASAMLRSADTTNQRPSAGGMLAVVSVNDDAFLNAADITTNMHMSAVELLLRRSRHP